MLEVAVRPLLNLLRYLSTSRPCRHILHTTRMRVVDNSEIGRLAHSNRKPPRVIHVYTPTQIGTIGDKVMVAVCGEKKRGYIVGVRKQQDHGVPRFDSNNVVLVDEGGNPLGNRVTVPIPVKLRSKMGGDFVKILAIASRFV